MKDKIIMNVLAISLILMGMVLGITLTIKLQKPTTIIQENGEGLTTISIDFLGQEWNYELNQKGVQSVND